MNSKRIGKIAGTAIVGILSAISGIASVEMVKSIKKETEKESARNHIVDSWKIDTDKEKKGI